MIWIPRVIIWYLIAMMPCLSNLCTNYLVTVSGYVSISIQAKSLGLKKLHAIFAHRSGSLSVHQSVRLSVCLFVCMFVCSPVCLFVCLPVWFVVCLSCCLFVCLSVCLFVCLSVCRYVCLSVCLFHLRFLSFKSSKVEENSSIIPNLYWQTSTPTPKIPRTFGNYQVLPEKRSQIWQF